MHADDAGRYKCSQGYSIYGADYQIEIVGYLSVWLALTLVPGAGEAFNHSGRARQHQLEWIRLFVLWASSLCMYGQQKFDHHIRICSMRLQLFDVVTAT